MTLSEFTQLVNGKKLDKYFDEHIALHSLVSMNFSANKNEILIDLCEDNKGCYYIIKAMSMVDLEKVRKFYDKIRINFFSHNFIVNAELLQETICIRFEDNRDMV